jgi:hypothetical protein
MAKAEAALCEPADLTHTDRRFLSRASTDGETLMTTLRLALIAAAASLTFTAAVAQTSQQPPQSEQSGYACGSKARAPATS